MKIISYNINGLRAATRKGLYDWLNEKDPDVICLQEIKILPEQADVSLLREKGYEVIWNPAERPGYSGVMIFSRLKPQRIHKGIGIREYDVEGRTLRLDFDNFTIMTVYMPSGSSGEHRQEFKIRWLNDFKNYVIKEGLADKAILCGDFNICHRPIDIHNPVSNKKSPGFTPEERSWFDEFLGLGFTDTFRHFDQEPGNYTWWTYRFNARKNNKGWRIDYFLVSNLLMPKVRSSMIYSQVVHSDHCPIGLEIDS